MEDKQDSKYKNYELENAKILNNKMAYFPENVTKYKTNEFKKRKRYEVTKSRIFHKTLQNLKTCWPYLYISYKVCGIRIHEDKIG